MRKTLNLVILQAVLWAAFSVTEGTAAEKFDLCKERGKQAAHIMESRQAGRELSDFAAKFNGKPLPEIILQAYEIPIASTDVEQLAATQSYADKVAAECYRKLGKAAF